MTKEIKCIMLIDDNEDDNFFHEREIKKVNKSIVVITKNSGSEALEYLQSKKEPLTELIFLDINMPGMNGWEFLKKYNQVAPEFKSETIIVMLSTSDNDDELEKAKTFRIISDFVTKPLTEKAVKKIIKKYF